MSKRYGLLGRNLAHSISPKIHQLIFKYTKINGEYELYPTEHQKVGSFICNLEKYNISGLNVTIPYKKEIIKYMHVLSDKAEEIGVVNTIHKTTKGLIGYNTDYFGLSKMLECEGMYIQGKSALVLGSGGLARTVVTLLKDKNCADILLVSRNKDLAQKEFSEIETASYHELKESNKYDLLINTTPVGMYPDNNNCPIDEKIIKGFLEVVDLIYNPFETMLLKSAKRNGAKIVNGLYMLVAQAVYSQEIWNGFDISDDIIEKIYSDIKDIK